MVRQHLHGFDLEEHLSFSLVKLHRSTHYLHLVLRIAQNTAITVGNPMCIQIKNTQAALFTDMEHDLHMFLTGKNRMILPRNPEWTLKGSKLTARVYRHKGSFLLSVSCHIIRIIIIAPSSQSVVRATLSSAT